MSEDTNTSTRKLNNKPETRRYIQRLYTKLNADPKNDEIRKEILKLTGLRSSVIEAIQNGTSLDFLDLTPKTIDRSVIFKQLVDFLLVKNTLATTKKLFLALGDVLPPHMDIATFRKLLYNMDFVWKKIPNNIFVVLERPEVTYERLLYLKHITEYHQKGTPIYFVEECFLDATGESFDVSETVNSDGYQRIVFAFSKTGIVFENSFLPSVSGEIEYRDWIFTELIPTLEEKSVIVINTVHFTTELFSRPTINSLKIEMTEWLDRHRVPYEQSATKSELMSLIETYTDLHTKYTSLEDGIIAHGHIPVRVPCHMHKCYPGVSLREHLKEDPEFYFDPNLSQVELQQLISSKIKSLSPALFESGVDENMKMYTNMLSDDMLIDEKLDLMINTNMANDNKDIDSDIPLDSDTD